MPFDTTRLIADKYQVIKKLSSGGQGSVYQVKDTGDGKEYAAKVARGKNALKREYAMYERLGCVRRQQDNFPTVYLHTRHGRYSVLVLSLFEKSLHDVKNELGGRLSMACVLKAGIHLVHVVRAVHARGIMHLDLKPANIMLRSRGSRKHRPHVIDFGLARLFRSRRSGRHISDGRSAHFRGTAYFASARSHRFRRPSRRDDLESLGYVLVYLAAGRLPWSGLSSSRASREFRQMGRMKRHMPVAEVCEGTVGIAEYLREVRKLAFAQRPNYDALIFCLQRALLELRGDADVKYDWQ